MNQLTKDNYFSINTSITNSKITDFLICKDYFKRKHIDGVIEPKKTKAFDIGSAVDDLLSQIDNKSKYAVVAGDGRTKEIKDMKAMYIAKGKTVLTADDYELIMSLACAVENTSAYQQIMKDGFIMQHILQVPWELGERFDSIAGIPDFYKIDGTKCIIVDLKTTTDLDARKYHYNCLGYGYYRQLAFYSILLEKLNPQLTEFEYLHLAVSKIKDVYPVKLFKLADDRVKMEKNNILHDILPQIASERDFKKADASFKSPEEIGAIFED